MRTALKIGGISGNRFAVYQLINLLGIESGMTEPIPLRGDFEQHAAQLIEFGP